MDAILDVFYEKVFAPLPRGALLSRYKREELVEYLGTVIIGCVSAEQVTTAEAVSRVVCSALHYHSAARDANGGLCLRGKFHDLLYVALKVAAVWEMSDSCTAARLLTDIHGCEGSFERLILGAVAGPRVSHALCGWKSDFSDRAENLNALEFFLRHAAKQRLQFGKARRRLADVPLRACGGLTAAALALDIARPDALAVFLKHGAVIKFPTRASGGRWTDGEDSSSDDESVENATGEETPSCFDPVLSKLIEWNEKHQNSNPNDSANSELTLSAVDREYSEEFLRAKRLNSEAASDMTRCLHMLLRSEKSAEGSLLLKDCREKVLDLIPGNRAGLAPPELKHLARFAIRGHLHGCWALPDGISLLGAPAALVRYLNLEED